MSTGRKLDFEKINKRIVGKISSEKALAEITPIEWSENVINEKKKVFISKEKRFVKKEINYERIN